VKTGCEGQARGSSRGPSLPPAGMGSDGPAYRPAYRESIGGGDKRACSFAPHREPVWVPTTCLVLTWTARVDAALRGPSRPTKEHQP
jgi:hypothetical protein